ncbi:hypothetical protein IVA88_29690 [Bradyrhizobium sp. 149]|nr:hypothetical protein [Bradyrhizobium sp. 149]MCK1655573.1 hypothetical protein [Bradyrhizobium sp. 149]
MLPIISRSSSNWRIKSGGFDGLLRFDHREQLRLSDHQIERLARLKVI